MIQVAERVWAPAAVHDTVEAVVRGSAFRRTLQSSIAERLMEWLSEWLTRLAHALRGAPSARALAIGVAGALVIGIAVRAFVAARARDAEALAASRAARRGATQDPWGDADRLLADGRFEEAAHALYHGVLSGVARRERLRLDPAKTSGDYARELRGRGSPSYAAFRAFVRGFDVAVYGYAGCTPESLGELRRLAEPFSPTARAA